MRLKKLLENLTGFKIFGEEDVSVSGVVDNSTKVKRDSCFVAIKGLSVDAHKFIPKAIHSGASVIVGEINPSKNWLKKMTYVKVADSRKALSVISSAWYGNPADKLKLIGVTGTDGKTTTSSIIYWILKTAGKDVGVITTVGARIGSKKYDTGFHVTNPEPLLLQKFLAKMVARGINYAVLEVTSHGLDQGRVEGINFDISVLTNITHEHLDYHKTFSNYLKAKSKLFNQSKIAVLNREDSSFEKIRRYLGKTRLVSYSSKSPNGSLSLSINQRFPESYNQSNARAAALVARTLGIEDVDISRAILTFPGVEGRMQEIKNDRGIRVIVDFAHTPNALKSVLSVLRKQLKKKSRLICVFGCAGERDREKRPMMGEVAAKFSDITILTAEDPRSERVAEIIDQIIGGFLAAPRHQVYYTYPNRQEAIENAINKHAKTGDIVVICGKGHEKSMNYNGRELPWSDYRTSTTALRQRIIPSN